MTKKDLLKKYNINIISLKKVKNATIITDNNKKYVYKKQLRKIDFYDYLISRGFNNFPKVYSNIDDEIELFEYIEEKEIPIEQKVEDLTHLISILHSKTIFDKQVDLDFIKKIYEEQISIQEELMNYYQNLQDIIEEETYMTPADYYLIRNISTIYKGIIKSREYLDKWYSEVKNTKIIRFAYIHGNLKNDNIIENNNLYLISWDKSSINNLVYDLENLYKNNYKNISIKDLLSIYESKLLLKKEEKDLFFSLILTPIKIDYNLNELDKIYYLTDMIMLLEEVLESDSKESNNNRDKQNKY